MWAAKFKCRRIHKWLNVMKLYYRFPNFSLYKKKKIWKISRPLWTRGSVSDYDILYIYRITLHMYFLSSLDKWKRNSKVPPRCSASELWPKVSKREKLGGAIVKSLKSVSRRVTIGEKTRDADERITLVFNLLQRVAFEAGVGIAWTSSGMCGPPES